MVYRADRYDPTAHVSSKDDGYRALCLAIIMQGIDDYRHCKRNGGSFRPSSGGIIHIYDVERFFKSRWFINLMSWTGIDPRGIWNVLRNRR